MICEPCDAINPRSRQGRPLFPFYCFMSHWICGSALKTLLSGGFASAALKRPAASVCPGISGRNRESLQLSNNTFGAKTYHSTEHGCNPAIERSCLKVMKLVFSSSALLAAGAAASSLINSGVEPSVKHSHKGPPPAPHLVCRSECT